MLYLWGMAMAEEALRRAIKLVGTSRALAEMVGVTPQALGQWGRVPAGRVLKVEKITGVPRHELRPDLYPPSDAAA